MEFHAIHPDSNAAAGWDTLAAKGSFYHTREWISICQAGLNAEAILLCVTDNDVIIAGMPGIINSRMGFRSFHSMPFGTYGGIVWRDDVSNGVREFFYHHLESYFKSAGLARILINDFYGACDDWSNDLLRTGQLETHVIACPDSGFILPKKAAVEIAAGENEGGALIVCQDSSLIEQYIDLYHLTDVRHGRRKHVYATRFLTTLFETLRATDRLYWNGIVYEDRLIGSQVHFLHGATQIYWQAVSHPDFRRFRLDYRMLNDAITHGRQRGMRSINLGASPNDADGLIAFKKRWGGEPRTYTVHSYHSRLYSLLRGR